MRRTERAVIEISEIASILNKCEVIRLGMSDDGLPYVVPLNFGYRLSEMKTFTLYFHCASIGKKLDILAKNPRICFEADHSIQILHNDTPCKCSCAYSSVIGFGHAIIIDNLEEKIIAMNTIMNHYGYTETDDYSESVLDRTTLVKIHVENITGKHHQS